ncbi:MAG: uroporphyrinogen-III C-methyltransferase [Halioglobus sp.]
MSDQEKTESTSNADDTQSEAAATDVATASAAPEAPAKKSSSGVAWLAILLVLGVAGASGWVVMEAQKREAAMAERVAELETQAQSKDTRLDALGEELKGEFKQSLSTVEAASSGDAFRLSKSIESLESQLAAQREELSRFSSADRDSWLMAEAEYLLRLANQRLIMAGDAEAAKALLESADDVLKQLDDTLLHKVRGAVAADLAAVRAVPKIDVEGIYLRLAALVEQASSLKIFQLPDREATPLREEAEGWKETLKQGYEAALGKLSDYIIIRRRDVPMQALMDPQWEGLVRQNLRMLLEQSQVALLSKNQTLYTESLERAQHWVNEFAESDAAAAESLSRELTQLGDEQVSVNLPDLSRSLSALDQAMERRLEQGGDE